jgi:GAF domain-containing protein
MKTAGQPTFSASSGPLDEVTQALETLGEIVNREDNVRAALQGVCEQVIRAVPGVDAASVTLLNDGQPETAASTNELIVELDREQYRIGRGPCLEAARTGEVVRVAVENADGVWPAFADAARAAGVGSFLSAPLVIDDQLSGAVNCYSLKFHGFVDFDEQLLGLYVAAVKGVLRGLRQAQEARLVAEQLRVALVSRAEIDQAKGILMAIHGITAQQAFDRLVEHSQRRNVKLHDVAVGFIVQAGGEVSAE